MNSKSKRIEDETPLIPLVVAECVCEEVERYTGLSVDMLFPAKLAEIAQTVYGANKTWAKSIKRANGREVLYSFTQHWLSGLLKDNQPEVWNLIKGTEFSNGIPLY